RHTTFSRDWSSDVCSSDLRRSRPKGNSVPMKNMSQSPSRHLSTLLLAALVSGLAACSLIVDFDPTGKPCDDEGGCLEGFVCNARSEERRGGEGRRTRAVCT